MKNKSGILLGWLLIVMFNACQFDHELKIDKIRHYEFKGFENNKLLFNIFLPVENQFKQNIIITEINLHAFLNNIPLGILKTKEKIIIKKNTKQNYSIPVTIQVTNVLGSLSLLGSPSKAIEQLRFEGYIKARKGLLLKKIKIDKEMSNQYLEF